MERNVPGTRFCYSSVIALIQTDPGSGAPITLLSYS